MPKRSLTDKQLEALILEELTVIEAYGRYHVPVDQMRKWLQSKIKRNGKKVSHCIDELVKLGLVVKTNRDTIYAVHSRLDEIYGFIDKNL